MKKTLFFTSAALLLVLTSCGPSKSDAVKYNDSIMTIVDGLKVDHVLFLDQMDGHNVDSLKITQKLFEEKAKSSLESSEKIGPFADKKEFSDVTHEYFNTLNSLAVTEGPQLVAIMSKDSTQLTQADLDKVTELASAFDDKYGKVYDKLKAEQVKFSTEWGFGLTEEKK